LLEKIQNSKIPKSNCYSETENEQVGIPDDLNRAGVLGVRKGRPIHAEAVPAGWPCRCQKIHELTLNIGKVLFVIFVFFCVQNRHKLFEYFRSIKTNNNIFRSRLTFHECNIRNFFAPSRRLICWPRSRRRWTALACPPPILSRCRTRKLPSKLLQVKLILKCTA
jgi:hypothetical protein